LCLAEDVEAVLEYGSDIFVFFGEEALHEEVFEVAVTLLEAVDDEVL
jgi:hypothetical protein